MMIIMIMMALVMTKKNLVSFSWNNPDWASDSDDPDTDDPEASKVRHSRPPRSVLYYLKGYETTISLTPVQLPPRSRILQV